MSGIFGHDVIAIADLDRNMIEAILEQAAKMDDALRRKERLTTLAGRVMASLFFQPSTRTRLSFETAMLRLGGHVIGFSDPEGTRSGASWREPLRDTARVLDGYVDIAVIRHQTTGAAREFASAASVPVINGGDGIGPGAEHPTQALLDLYTIRRELGRLDNLTIVAVGGLHQRVSHSLLTGLSRFSGIEVLLLCPTCYWLSADEEGALRAAGLKLERIHALDDVMADVDVIYHNGMGEDPDEPVPAALMLTAEKVRRARQHAIVLHPLPRAAEIPTEVDELPQAKFFEQARNGVPLRMAVLDAVLNSRIP